MIHHGDCLEVMGGMPDASVDAIVTDPPYGLGFMGKAWDDAKRLASVPPSAALRIANGSDVGRLGNYPGGKGSAAVAFDGRAYQGWCQTWAVEALRVAKPGAYLLAFGGTRTSHRLACALEDAGWEIRDTLVWAYASGFPKSLDVSKAIDKAAPRAAMFAPFAAHYGERRRTADLSHSQVCAAIGAHAAVNHGGASVNWEAGHNVPTLAYWQKLRPILGLSDKWLPLIERVEAERAVVGQRTDVATRMYDNGEGPRMPDEISVTAPATDAARQWAGFGTALKPAWEPIIMARKPLAGTVASTVLRYGTGALNIDECRIGTDPIMVNGYRNDNAGLYDQRTGSMFKAGREHVPTTHAGRWPSNVILTDPIFDGGVEGVVGGGRQDSPATYTRSTAVENWGVVDRHMPGDAAGDLQLGYGDTGIYSRFFILPKASRSDREPVVRGTLALQPVVKQTPLNNPDFAYSDGSHRSQNRPRENAHPTVKPVELMRHLVRLVTPPGGTVLDPFAGSGSTLIAAEQEGFAWIGIEKEAEYVAIAEARLNGTQRGLGLDVPAPTRTKGIGKQRGNKDADGHPGTMTASGPRISPTR